jgi:hypothetical protein
MHPPRTSPRRSESSAAAPKPERYYPIRRTEAYSLKDAAAALAVPEGQLRRAILLSDLPALDVPDDRQYLLLGSTLRAYVQALRPEENCRFDPGDDVFYGMAFLAILPLIALIVSLCIMATTSPSRVQCRLHPALPAPSAPMDAERSSPIVPVAGDACGPCSCPKLGGQRQDHSPGSPPTAPVGSPDGVPP